MTANAEAGYWNGATPPSGYETAIAAVLRNGDPAFRRAWCIYSSIAW